MSKTEIKRLAENYVSSQLKTMSKAGKPLRLSSDERKKLVKSAMRKVAAVAK